jgi:uncharacterized repeat protein (TIGR01451 family)
VVEYTITYGNTGYDNATNVVLTEIPDAWLAGINFAGTWNDMGGG